MFDAKRFGALLRIQNPDMFASKLNAWQERTATADRFRAAVSGTTLELNILDVIGYDWWTDGGITSKAVKQSLDAHPDVADIHVVMDSPGGSAFDGVAIRSLLNRHPARVTVEVVGLAASAASLIAMAGDSREMHIGAEMMIHRAASCICGHAEQMRKEAEALDVLDEGIVDIYVDRTGGDRKVTKKMVHAETWMNAEEAVAKGFADVAIKKKAQPAVTAVGPEDDPAEPAPRVSRVAVQRPFNQLRSSGRSLGD